MIIWYFAAIPVFGLLVFIHELGHFLTAKWAGIRVEEFGLGFPPNLVGIRKRDQGGWDVIWFGRQRDEAWGEKQTPFSGTSGGPSVSGASPSNHTLYSLNLLPIGGFVRMPGENGDVHDENGNYDPQSFAAKPAGKRIIVLVAGVVMNVLLAMVLFTIAYGLGEPTSPAVIGQVVPDSPAAHAGLRSNDKIISVNGHPVQLFNDIVTTVGSVTTQAAKQHQQTVDVNLVVQHQGDTGTSNVTVHALVTPPSGQGHMGVTGKVVMVTYPLWQAPGRGIVHTYEVTRDFIQQIEMMITGTAPPQVAGVVGIVNITGQVAQTIPTIGWWPILSLTAILSLNLAVVNILPFPALDGGRIVLVLIEVLRGGKRLKPEREGIINLIGMAILLTLMVVITISDVIHWTKM